MKKIGLFLLLSVSVFARFDANPVEECKAFNNMKHTQNTHNVVLDTRRKYTVLRRHKGQNLILVSGEQPAQRWVDERCFSKSKKHTKSDDVTKVAIPSASLAEASNKKSFSTQHSKNLNHKISKQNLLVLSWHNAFCETHRYKKECKRKLLFAKKRYSDTRFILHGLWPQPKSKMYCGASKKEVGKDKNKQWQRLPDLGLSETLKESLLQVMPGFSSNLHKHEWIKHGTCYGTSVDEYFSTAIALTQQVNNSKIGTFFSNNIGKQVNLKQIRKLFDDTFGRGAGDKVQMQCKGGLLTELWIHIGSGGKDLKSLLKNGKKVRSRCHKGRIDKVGFGR